MTEYLVSDLPDVLPTFYESRLKSDPYYNDIYLLIVDPGDTETDLLQKLATKLGAGGKRGVAVLIMPIENADDDEIDTPVEALRLAISFQIWENRQINKAVGGTGKNAWGVARHTATLFKHYSVRGLAKLLVPDKPAIQRVPPPAGYEKKLRGWSVNFTGREDVTTRLAKVALPVFTPGKGAASSVQITCPTAGATIYYTTDGTPPGPNENSATAYSAPIPVPAEGLNLFAVAVRDGSFPSDTISAIFTNA